MGFQIRRELKIIKDHYRFRVIKRTRPLHIHTEAIYKDAVWKRVQKFVLSGRSAVWFCLTPVNYEYVKIEFGCALPKARYEQVLLQRYRWLAARGQDIQLHVHMRVLPELYDSPQESLRDQEDKLRRALAWMRTHGFAPTKIVYGWWAEDEHSRALATQHGLENQQRFEHYYIHDYDFLLKKLV